MNSNPRLGSGRSEALRRIEPDDVVTMLTPILYRMAMAAGTNELAEEPVPARPLSMTPSLLPDRDSETEHENPELGPHHGCRLGRHFAED